MNKILLRFDQVMGLIRIGLVVGDAIVGKVRDGAVEVDKDGAVMTSEQVAAEIDAAQAVSLNKGDAAADRITDRSDDDGA